MYTREAKAKRISGLYAKDPSRELQGKNSTSAETEQYWEKIWEKEADQRADHSNLPEQEPESLRQTSNNNSLESTAPGPHVVHMIQPLHDRLAAQIRWAITAGTHPDWLTVSQSVSQKNPVKDATPSNYQLPEQAHGCTQHQLLVDRAAHQDSGTKQTSLSTATGKAMTRCSIQGCCNAWHCVAANTLLTKTFTPQQKPAGLFINPPKTIWME